MNVLVLGGNGYLGSKVVRWLVEKNYNVVCTKRTSSDLSRIIEFKDKIKMIPASVDSVESAMKYMDFDFVINVACNYGRSDVLYGNVIEANIEFPLRVLNKVAESGYCNYITIGTGLPDDMNMYSFSKKVFNEFGKFYCDKHKVNFICLTLQMLYGADEPIDRFLPSIIRKMILGEDVNTTIGTQHRDIISVEDVVKSIDLVMGTHLEGYWDIPVGTGVAPTISEIVDYIWDITDNKSKVNKGVIPMRDNEPDCIADIRLIKSLGEWMPLYWKDGINIMIEDIKGQLNCD
ncbi:CDP-paratose synthetase [Lachnospiraceae bacterium NE2001]|nr:CDP-paratose synthetase [Lachnospiraceae bacterium NE2001]